MSSSFPATRFDGAGDDPRLAEIRQVVEECARRRSAGETVSDAELLASHSHLLPELRSELANLALISGARRRATSRANRSSNGTQTPRPRMANSMPGAPDFVPGYEFIERIGYGGQGVVYRARHVATDREVAIKIMGSGPLAGRNPLERFRREVRVLARLRHPNIVTIHDSGTAAGGNLYLVMDYVAGRALDAFADAPLPADARDESAAPSQLRAIRKTLALFVKVCDAVATAHVRGVIHRDLKPSNILLNDANEPHILDFGLAKLTGESPSTAPSIDAMTAMTMTGQFVGSLPWASPEQAAGTSEVDLRTDIYSLGAMLFFALTNELPYETEGGMPTVLNRIINSPPRRASQIRSAIDTDIDTIIMKCLAKEPTRRYQSAGELGRDMQRYLDGLPIEARRDSQLYVLRKTINRNKLAFGSAAAAIIALVAFAGYASVQAEKNLQLAQRERVALDAAREANIEMAAARDRAAAQEQLATAEAHHAESVTAFLVEMLGLADPDVTQAPDMTMADMLARATPLVEEAFADQPEAEIQVRTVMGRAHATLGNIESAHRQLARAWQLVESREDSSARQQYEVLSPYVDVLHEIQSPVATRRERTLLLQVYEVIAKEYPALRDAQHAVRLATRRAAEEPEVVRETQRELRELIDSELVGDPRGQALFADLIDLYGNFVWVRDHHDLAEMFYRDALAINRATRGETNSKTATTLRKLVDCLLLREDFAEAESLAFDSMAALRRKLPANHWYFAVPQAQIGRARLGLGDVARAEAMLVQSYETIQAARGANSPHTMYAANALIDLYEFVGKADDAREFRDALAVALYNTPNSVTWANSAPAFGPEHETLARALGELTDHMVEDTEQVPALLPAVLAETKSLQHNDPRAGLAADLLRRTSDGYINRGGEEEPFLAMLNESHRLHSLLDEPNDLRFAMTLWWLSHVNYRIDPQHGLDCGLEALERYKRSVGERDWLVANAKQAIAGNLIALQRYEEAASYALAGYEDLLVRQGARNVNTYVALMRLIDAYGLWGRPDLAADAVMKTLTPWKSYSIESTSVYNLSLIHI